MPANEMQVRLQVPIGISHRLSLLSAAARKVASIPQSRIAGRAVTVLDQDRSDRSWSWDQGLVLEVLGEIGPKWSLKTAEI